MAQPAPLRPYELTHRSALYGKRQNNRFQDGGALAQSPPMEIHDSKNPGYGVELDDFRDGGWGVLGIVGLVR